MCIAEQPLDQQREALKGDALVEIRRVAELGLERRFTLGDPLVVDEGDHTGVTRLRSPDAHGTRHPCILTQWDIPGNGRMANALEVQARSVHAYGLSKFSP